MAVISSILGALGAVGGAIAGAASSAVAGITTAAGAIGGALSTAGSAIGGLFSAGTVTGGAAAIGGGTVASTAATTGGLAGFLGTTIGGTSITVGGALAGVGLIGAGVVGATMLAKSLKGSQSSQQYATLAKTDALNKLSQAGKLDVNETAKTITENSRMKRTLNSLRIPLGVVPQQDKDEITKNVFGVDTNTVATVTQNMTGLNIAIA